MFDSILNYLDKFGPELLVIQSGFLVILSTIFLWLWFSNRRKYHNLKHAIPANIVKSYLDSIIQNSTSLKSQLFRGGGLDVNGGSVPSVMSLSNLIGGEGLAVSGAPSTALLEELNQKKAQIASLEAQLAALLNSQKEIETKFGQSQSNLTAAQVKIKELEALLAQGRSGANGDAALKSELNMVSKERDDLRDRLKEFEIIADDLANLKRLQQENEQLRKSLAAAGVKVPSSQETPPPVSKAEVSDLFEDLGQSGSKNAENPALDDFLAAPEESYGGEETPAEEFAAGTEASDGSETEESAAAAAMESFGSELAESLSEAPAEEISAAAEVEVPAEEAKKSKSDKTPEDLLSEFEKMLG